MTFQKKAYAFFNQKFDQKFLGRNFWVEENEPKPFFRDRFI